MTASSRHSRQRLHLDELAAALEIQHGNLAASTVDRMRCVEGPEAPVAIINRLTLDAYRQASVAAATGHEGGSRCTTP